MEIFKLFGSIFVDSSAAEKSISNTSSKAGGLATKLGGVVKTAAKVGAGLGAAAVAGTTAMFKMATSAADTADNIDKMSQKIGISKQAYQELDYICQLTGASVDNMRTGMKTLVNAMGSAKDGTGATAEIFERLGVSVTDTEGNLRSQEEVMWETIEALQGVENQTDKATMASKLFGKQGQDLMPLLNSEAGSIEEMKRQAHDLGLIMSDESVEAGAKFNDSLTQVKDAFGAIVTKIGIEVMPIFQKFLDWIIEHIPEIQQFFADLKEKAEPIFEKIGELIGAVQNAFARLREAAETDGTLINAVWTGIQACVETVWEVCGELINAFIALLNGDFAGAWNAIQNTINAVTSYVNNIITLYFGAIKNFIGDVFAWIRDTAVGQFFSSAISKITGFAGEVYDKVTGVFQSIRDFVEDVVDTIKSAWEAVTTVYVPEITSYEAEGAMMDGYDHFYDPIYHDKAMDNAILLNGATVFGRMGGRNMVGGETGQEMIVGTNTLYNSIAQASGSEIIADCFDKLFDILGEYLPMMNRPVVLDTGAIVGGTVDKMKSEIDRIYRREKW